MVPSAALLLPLLLSQCAAPAPVPPAPRGASCRGRVLRALDLRPVPGAKVAVSDTESATLTAANGSFLLEGLPPGRRDLVVSPADHVEESVGIALREGRETTRDVFVREGAVLEGRVLDEEGNPVAGARVEGCGGTFALGDPDGRFLLRGQDPDPWWPTEIRAFAAGFRDGQEDVHVRPGFPRLHLDFTLERVRPWRMEGRVLREGLPVPGAAVRAENLERRRFLTGPVVADASGTFRLESDEEGDPLRVVALEDGQVVGESRPARPVRGDVTREVDVHLWRTRTLKGVVRDREGAPLPKASVRAYPLREAGGAVEDGEENPPRFRMDAEADGSGAFRLHLLPGRWALEAAGGRHPDFTGAGTVEIPADGPLPGRDIVLKAIPPPGATLAGRIVDEEGAPVEGAYVGGVTTDAEGRFLLEGLVKGEADAIPVFRTGFLGGFMRWSPSDPPTGDFVLERGSTLRGTVLLPDGATPARSFEVSVFDDEGRDGALFGGTHAFPDRSFGFVDLPVRRSVNARDGRFEISGLDDGVVAVVVRSGDLIAPMVRGFRIQRGEDPEELHLRLEPGPVLAVEVLDGGGKPAPGLEVELRSHSPDDEMGFRGGDGVITFASTDEAGRAEFRVLQEDPCWVVLGNGRGTDLAGRKVVVPPRGTTRVVMTLPGTGLLRLEAVVGEGGEEAAAGGVHLEFLDEEGDVRSVLRHRPDGWEEEYRLDSPAPGPGHAWPGIAAGAYRAAVFADGCAPPDIRFPIRRGALTPVRVTLNRK